MAGEWFERSDHPLLNDVVLSKVFKFVRPLDLKECRVTCRKWNVSTIPLTRNAWKVTIYGNESHDWRLMSIIRDARMIGKFVELFSLNKLGIPFARFRLGAFCLTDVVGQQFLGLCGEIAQEIDFSWHEDICMVEDMSELLSSTPNLVKFKIPNNLQSRSSNIVGLFRDSPENSKPKLPFLTSLKSGVDSVDSRGHRTKFCPTFTEELFKAAENISHLSFGYSVMEENRQGAIRIQIIRCTSLKVLSIIEELGKEAAVETIHFAAINEEDVEILRRMKSNGMKLKRIKVGESFQHSIQVATIFKDTLEHLRISSVWSGHEGSVNFPKMPRLTYLKIHVDSIFELRLLNLSYIFPALMELDLDQFGHDEEYDEFFSESDPCQKIKSMKVCSCTMKITGFSRTLSLFPELAELKLDIKMDGSVVRNIWSQMTQLQVLVLMGSIETTENLDSIFTGISTESLLEIEPLVNELEEMTGEVRKAAVLRLRNQHSLRPSIANLTNLRRLEIDVRSKINDEDDFGSTYLTDLTGYLGFYGMKELCHLKIDQSKLTKSCCEILTTDLGLQSWIFLRAGYGKIISSVAY